MTTGTFILIGILIVAIVVLYKTIYIVPQKHAFIVERLGKYSKTLEAGFHILLPFLDRIAYRHTLKEQAIDVPPQVCITQDNISVEVDGILYMQVFDAAKASYGIDHYDFASTQLAQTTMRSIIGKMELDKTFEERDKINGTIVRAVDEASDPWGVKVSRYEVKNIVPPQSIKDAMEKQMRAERQKRAEIAKSEGDRQANINRAEGVKQQSIQESEGERQKRINEAEGKAREIELIATATAESLKKIGNAIEQAGGKEAVNLRIAEQYVEEFGKLAQTTNTTIIPSNLSDIGGFVKSIQNLLDKKL
ncbi:MAG: SPFH/Band 7/PHB domain protein [Deltaproteobacteria bacterium]|jgi:regulator of protease activity HflC (stomatin/prohibitin superfamily)|nr:SPFH/Band 7/PHB domain protein [Deltaproteobacteria bacterium]